MLSNVSFASASAPPLAPSDARTFSAICSAAPACIIPCSDAVQLATAPTAGAPPCSLLPATTAGSGPSSLVEGEPFMAAACLSSRAAVPRAAVARPNPLPKPADPLPTSRTSASGAGCAIRLNDDVFRDAAFSRVPGSPSNSIQGASSFHCEASPVAHGASPSSAVPSVTIVSVAVTHSTAASDDETHFCVEKYLGRDRLTVAPPGGCMQVLAGEASSSSDVLAGSPEQVKNGKRWVSSRWLCMKGSGHNSRTNDRSNEGISVLPSATKTAKMTRSVGETTTAEGASMEGEEPLGETKRWGTTRELPHPPRSTVVYAQDEDSPSTAPWTTTVDPTATQRLSTARSNSPAQILHSSIVTQEPSAATNIRLDVAQEEEEASFSTAAEVDCRQSATTGIEGEKDAVESFSVKVLPHKGRTGFVLEETQQQGSSLCKKQLETNPTELQQQQVASYGRVRQRNLCSAWKQQQPQREEAPTVEEQHQEIFLASHHKAASSRDKLGREDVLYAEPQQESCSLPLQQQENTLSQLQETDVFLLEQQGDSMPPFSQEQKGMVRGTSQQDQHGLEALLRKPLSSLAESMSSPSLQAVPRSRSVEASITCAAEAEHRHKYTVIEEGQLTQQHEQQLPSQQHPPQQLLTSAGDLLWRMGKRIGSGSRAAAEAAASAAAKAASAAAVATIGEPTVMGVLSKGSLETHSISSVAGFWRQELGDDNRSGSGTDRVCAEAGDSNSADNGNFRARSRSPVCNGGNNLSQSGSASSSSRVDSNTRRLNPNESDTAQSDLLGRGIIDEEELLQERDALREQVRIYQEVLAQLLTPPMESQDDHRGHVDRGEQQRLRKKDAQEMSAVAAAGSMSPSCSVLSYTEKTIVSEAEQQCAAAHEPSPRNANAFREQDKRQYAVAEEDLKVAVAPADPAAVPPAAEDTADTAASFAGNADPLSDCTPDGQGPPGVASVGAPATETAGSSDERDKRETGVFENDSRTLQDGSWCTADAAKQLQQQLVELLYERAASAAAAVATTAAEANMSILLGSGGRTELIDTAAVAAAISVALSEDDDLLRCLHQLLNYKGSSASESMSNVRSSRRRWGEEYTAVNATLSCSTASLQDAFLHRRTRSANSSRQRRQKSTRDHRSTGSRDSSRKERNLYDGTGSCRSEEKELRITGSDESSAVNAGERAQFLAKIQQQQLELEQYRDINERQTKQLMQLTLQLTSFKTEADERTAEERLQQSRARPLPEKDESIASCSTELQEDVALTDGQQQQLEELTRAAAESFGLKCHLQELSKVYTRATEKEAALRQELSEVRRELKQQQQLARVQQGQSLEAERQQQQDVKTDAPERATQDKDEFYEGAAPFPRTSSSSALTVDVTQCDNHASFAAARTEAPGPTMMVDAAVQTCGLGNSLPLASSSRTVSGGLKRLLTPEAGECEVILVNSPGVVSKEVSMQQMGTAEREEGTELENRGNAVGVGAAAALGGAVARVRYSDKDGAAGAQTCFGAQNSQPPRNVGEASADSATRVSAGLTADAAVAPEAHAVPVCFERPLPRRKVDVWSGKDSRGDGRKEKETLHEYAVVRCDAAVSTENSLAGERIVTSGGPKERDVKESHICEPSRQVRAYEQERALRIAMQRIQSLEFELESFQARHVGERRRMQRHMLDLRTLCLKEKQRREKAEAQCERLTAAALEQQAFVLQKPQHREDLTHVCEEDHLDLSNPLYSCPPSSVLHVRPLHLRETELQC